MAKIYYLGTCSGTEPMVGMHHCSWILEVNGAIYWFDAGEGCMHTAYTGGIDIMQTRALFVTHPHIDHIGGLPLLLFGINKMEARYSKVLPCDNTLRVFFPEPRVFDAIMTVTAGKQGGKLKFDIDLSVPEDGVIFSDENVTVTALHNRHLKEDGADGVWHSFSYLIQCEGKRFVFSGDVASLTEVDDLIGDGAELLITETGHHRVADVCSYAASRNIKNLRFIHHGREILEGREQAERYVSAFAAAKGFSAVICRDGTWDEI